MITRLRTGDTLYAVLNVTSGTPCIFYDDVQVYDNFTEEEPLFLQGAVASQAGVEVDIVSARWKVNGAEVANNNFYQVENDLFKIIKCPFSDVKDVVPLTIEWIPTVKSQGYTQEISKIFSVEARKISSSSYWGTIKARGNTILSKTNSSVVLEQSLMLGQNKVEGYDVKWLLNDTQISTGTTVTINDSQVNGMALVTCEFYVDGKLVEADSISISDISDELRIVVNSNYYVGSESTDAVTIAPKLVRVKSDGTLEQVTKNIKWSVQVKENFGLNTISDTEYQFNGSTGEFKMYEELMYYKGEAISPIVVFTAEV